MNYSKYISGKVSCYLIYFECKQTRAYLDNEIVEFKGLEEVCKTLCLPAQSSGLFLVFFFFF